MIYWYVTLFVLIFFHYCVHLKFMLLFLDAYIRMGSHSFCVAAPGNVINYQCLSITQTPFLSGTASNLLFHIGLQTSGCLAALHLMTD